MHRSLASRAPARSLIPLIKGWIRELGAQPRTGKTSGERAAYTRLLLMAHVPFRSLARLRKHCETHAGLIGGGDPYSEGLGRGYRRALVEIDRATGESRPPVEA